MREEESWLEVVATGLAMVGCVVGGYVLMLGAVV